MAGVVDIAPRVQIDGCLFPSHRPRLGAADWLTRGRRGCGLRLSLGMWLRQGATRRLLICVIWHWHWHWHWHLFTCSHPPQPICHPNPPAAYQPAPVSPCLLVQLKSFVIGRTAQSNILFQPLVHTCDILQVQSQSAHVFIQILAGAAPSHPRSSRRTPIGLSSLPWQHPASASTHRAHLSHSSPRP